MNTANLLTCIKETAAMREQWLKNVSAEQVGLLHNGLKKVSIQKWYAWRRYHAELITSFVAHGPLQVAPEGKFEKDWLLLHLAAIQQCDEALAVLRPLRDTVLCEQLFDAHAAVSAGSQVFESAMLVDIADWPFADPNPFESQNPPD